MEKLVPEGIEGRVQHKGSMSMVVHQVMGGLRAGMGYCGAATIPDLQRDAESPHHDAGFRESHVHDVTITKEAPNYRVDRFVRGMRTPLGALCLTVLAAVLPLIHSHETITVLSSNATRASSKPWGRGSRKRAGTKVVWEFAELRGA